MNARTRPRPARPLSLHARTAADLMTEGPLSIRQAATVEEAAAFLSGRGISAAPVIDEAGRPVGVVSRTDLLSHLARSGPGLPAPPNEARPDQSWRPRVRDVMTPAVFCARPETAAARVVEMMLALKVRRLFIVDGVGVLVGVVSAFDVLRGLAPRVGRQEGGTR